MAIQWNYFLAFLLLVAATYFRLVAGAGDDEDEPFMRGEDGKGYQVIYMENLMLEDFYIDCKGYQNHDMNRAFDIASGYVRRNAKFTMEFDRIKSWRLFEVYCTYYGADDCSAEKVRVFFAPAGEDMYYCSRYSTGLVRGCGYRFHADGKVDKLVGANEVEYVGRVPMRKNYRKICIWKSCFRPLWWETLIGEVQCCGGTCN